VHILTPLQGNDTPAYTKRHEAAVAIATTAREHGGAPSDQVELLGDTLIAMAIDAKLNLDSILRMFADDIEQAKRKFHL
jgi:hypothetical protein